MTEPCTHLTAAGSPCRRTAAWRLVPPSAGPGCHQHAIAAARRLRALELVNLRTAKALKVTAATPIRRKPFTAPATVDQVTVVLSRVQSLAEWSQVFRAVCRNRWCRFTSTDPIYRALVNAKHRLLASASPAELALYAGIQLKGAS